MMLPASISVVIPCFNEEKNVALLYQKLIPVLESIATDYEVIFVDDGSRDDTFEEIKKLHQANGRIKGISFSKNFGHQIALLAGMQQSSGEAVISMDGDLQHPPEVIPELVKQYRAGFDIVNTRRLDEESARFLKKSTSRWFYKVINFLSDIRIEPASADFRLMSRKTVDAFKVIPERDRFTRGLVSWMGFKQTIIEYQAQPRAHGQTKYTLKKMFQFALNGVTSFSAKPLRLSFYSGIIISFLGLLYAFYAMIAFLYGETLQGWASILLSLLIIGGAILINLGIVGEYIARIFNEVKARPLYFIKDQTGVSGSNTNTDD